MKRNVCKASTFFTAAAASGLLATTAGARNSNAVFGAPQLDPVACTLSVSSSKDVSNYTVDSEKTELGGGTTTLVLQVGGSDVVTVKSGTTVWTYTVPADFCASGSGE